MKRELAAGALLLLLIIGSIWNILYLDRFIEELDAMLNQAEYAAQNGDWDTARSFASLATRRWNAADDYTHIFIRHPEIDSTADAFYELSQLLLQEDEGFEAAFGKLRYHLYSIKGMEHPSLGSIF